MPIWNNDQAPINLPLPTMGGKVFWEELDEKSGYTLQKHKLEGHCRILNADNVRVAWGTEAQMRAELRRLTEPERRAVYGDVIGVHRYHGVYDHYGIYENDETVYHYAAENSDFGKASVHVTTLSRFIADSGSYFVLVFPESYAPPAQLSMDAGMHMPNLLPLTGILMREAVKAVRHTKYHLYSPEETIARAKSRLGEDQYNLVMNNCEHFAIWCKTGISESHQVNALLERVMGRRL